MKHLISCALFLLLLTGVVAKGQVKDSVSANEFPSGIAGRLTTLDGAVIPGAKIRIIARSTKKFYAVETDARGEYVADLDPGIYDVEAEAAGFKKAKRKSIPVARGGRSFVDIVMSIDKKQVYDSKHP